MLNSLFKRSETGTFDIRLANQFGLKEAVYINAILQLDFNEDGSVNLDRNYIKQVTTLSEAEQNTIEKELQNINLLSKLDDVVFKVDINILITFITQDSIDKNSSKDLKAVLHNKAEQLSSKKDYIITGILKKLKTNNAELVSAYTEWLYAVYDKLGWINSAALEEAEECIDKYSNHNLDKALAIIKIATINGYRNVSWAIKLFEENSKLFNGQSQVQNNRFNSEIKPIAKEFK